MQLLFADQSGECPRMLRVKIPTISGGANPSPKPKRPWYDILIEQLANSAIVGGIAGLSSLVSGEVSWRVAAIAFGMTTLIELRKYRGLTK